MSKTNPGSLEAASTDLIDPDMALAMAKLADMVAADGGVPTTIEGDREQQARFAPFWNEGSPDVGSIIPLTIEGARGPLQARLYKNGPEHTPVALFMHGGGFVRGSLDHCDSICRRMVADSQLSVVSTTYSLAPEHPFPAAVEDIVKVMDWMFASAGDYGLDADRVSVCGGSAGAMLAMTSTLRRRDAGARLPVGMALFYGAYDITNTERQSYRLFGTGEFGMSKARVQNYYIPALVPAGTSPTDPYLAPLHADLNGLPPVWMGVAELDVLRDEQLEMADRLRAAGVPLELHRYEGHIHGFANRARLVPRANEAIRSAAQFLAALPRA
ncbi:alpha/beta hydrolase [Mesorhizobium sp. B4-1-4]|uniref:alpha/beta hydrolase n=1 Tax=Mesorhizobium sp. B4-1-4 TaxID=2589888 RepID=UPI0015E308F2|nr:alpha/beta hydrolase [Mesorhizobium sp. B4-1-4]UCI31728.1 alpha/beta hydrolase [Mesorhizobium sp. B4-1-4]